MFALAVATLPAQSAIGDIPVTGTVTDKAGTPLQGVKVSDGRKWSWTDSEGRFSINEPATSGFILTASKTGLVSESFWGTAFPGTIVDFRLFYILSTSLSPEAFNNFAPKTITITVKSYAPRHSCVTWTDIATGNQVELMLSGDSVGGESAWIGSYSVPSETVDSKYATSTIVKDCTTTVALTRPFNKTYKVDSVSPFLRAITPLNRGNASMSPLRVHALVQDGLSGVNPASVTMALADLGTKEAPSSSPLSVGIDSFRADIGLLVSQAFTTTDLHIYEVKLSAADVAGNSFSTTTTFLANRWGVLEQTDVRLNHGDPIEGPINLEKGTKRWTFPDIMVSVDPLCQ